MTREESNEEFYKIWKMFADDEITYDEYIDLTDKIFIMFHNQPKDIEDEQA